MKKSAILTPILFLLLIIPCSYSYIDPGTGGMIASSVWTWITGILGFFLGLFVLLVVSPVKKMISRLLKRNN